MFENTLLDSSPSRTPVLNGAHYAIILACGIAAFAAVYYILPSISMAETSVIVFWASLLGGVVLTWALMVTFVFADSRHVGLSRGLWVAVAFLIYLGGYLLYAYASAKKTGEWKRLTIPVAYIFEVILIGAMLIYPLIYTEALPKAQLMTFLVAPPPPPPPPPPPAAAPPVKVVRRVTADDIMRAPTVIPRTIAVIKDEPEPPPQAAAVGVVGGVPGGMPGGTPGGVLGSILSAAAPPPPPPPKATTPKRIRVGGQVEQAKIIFRPTPEYPPLAKVARIQGVVRLEAIISRDGTVQDLKVLNGHPLLVKSALEAVQRWRYQPTLLNGEPVEIITEIDVNFSLAN